MSIRIVIGGDQPLFRTGLALLLDKEGFTVLGDATGCEVLEIVASTRPEVAILNLFTPDSKGLQLAREMRQRSPGTRIIVIADQQDDHGIQEAPIEHIAGYVPTSESPEVLVAAISEVAQGGTYLCKGWLSNKRALSQREDEVFRFIAEGKRPREIAVQLGLSSKTVEAHRSRIMSKLQINDIAHLVRYAIREGLLSA